MLPQQWSVVYWIGSANIDHICKLWSLSDLFLNISGISISGGIKGLINNEPSTPKPKICFATFPVPTRFLDRCVDHLVGTGQLIWLSDNSNTHIVQLSKYPCPCQFWRKKTCHNYEEKSSTKLQSYFSFGPKAHQNNLIQTFVGHFFALNDEYDIPPITEMSEIEHCKYEENFLTLQLLGVL